MPFKIMSIPMLSVIVDVVIAVVWMLLPRVMLFPEMLKAAVIPAEPSLVKLIPAMVVPAVRLLTGAMRVSPVKVIPPASVQFGDTFPSQFAGDVKLSFTPPPSQICPACTKGAVSVTEMAASERN